MELDYSKLKHAIEDARNDLRPFREERLKFIKQYCGFHYGTKATSRRVPLNKLHQAVNTFVQYLSSQTPRVLVTTYYRELEAFSQTFQLALNHLIRFEIPLGSVLRRVATQAMFAMGVVKIGLAPADQGLFKKSGKPFVDVVDFDNWVFDTAAGRMEDCRFFGDFYKIPAHTLLENPNFTLHPALQEKLSKSAGSDYDAHLGEETAQDLTKGSRFGRDDFIPQLNLLDVFVPDTNQMFTFLEDEDEPIRVVDWTGPKGGPYRVLSFGEVPGNVMPLAPATQWIDLHESINILYNKAIDQAKRQKTVLGVHGAADQDAKRIATVGDGEGVRIDHPDKVKEFKFSGVDQNSFAFMLNAIQQYSALAGNLDVLAGLAPQSDTVGQEQILASSASKRVQDMQDAYVKFLTDVVRDVGYYLWTDPFITIPLQKEYPGMEFLQIPTMFKASEKMGEYYNYTIEISPYSIQPEGPGQKLLVVRGVMQELLPLSGLLQAQGIAPNIPAYLDLVSKYANVPELAKVFEAVPPPPPMMGPPPGEPHTATKAPNTTRTEKRVSVKANPMAEQQAQAMQMMTSGGE